MESYTFDCPVCECSEKEDLFRAFDMGKWFDISKVVVCTHCGFVYKNPVAPGESPAVYLNPDLWDTDYFRKRADDLAEYLKSELDLKPGMKLLEIGAARGYLLKGLKDRFPTVEMFGIEPAAEVAECAAKENPSISMQPLGIDDCDFLPGSFDAVLTIGVDYLFLNHGRALRKISDMLRDEGQFYIERNMFLKKRTLTDNELFDAEDFFGKNSMFQSWFTDELFRVQLERFFDIEKVVRSVKQLIPPRNLENYHIGYWCRKNESKSGKPVFPDGYEKWYPENRDWVRNMARETSVRELQVLRASGIKNVLIYGFTDESKLLVDLIDEIDGLNISAIISEGQLTEKNYKEYDIVPLHDVYKYVKGDDSVLIATLDNQEGIFQQLQSAFGKGMSIFKCFRTVEYLPDVFSSDAEDKVQMKAFLPATLSGLTNNPDFILDSSTKEHERIS